MHLEPSDSYNKEGMRVISAVYREYITTNPRRRCVSSRKLSSDGKRWLMNNRHGVWEMNSELFNRLSRLCCQGTSLIDLLIKNKITGSNQQTVLFPLYFWNLRLCQSLKQVTMKRGLHRSTVTSEIKVEMLTNK